MPEEAGAVVPTRADPSFFVALPRRVVFAYLADPRNRPAWQASLARVDLIDEGEPRVGMRWVDHLRLGPSFELRIVALRPDELWAEQGTTGPVTAEVTLLFADETRAGVTGTRVRIVVRFRGAGPGRPLGWLATGAMALLVRFDIPRIKRALPSP